MKSWSKQSREIAAAKVLLSLPKSGFVIRRLRTGSPVEYLMSHCRGVLTTTNKTEAKVFESQEEAHEVIRRYSRSKGVTTTVWVEDPRMPLYNATVEKI